MVTTAALTSPGASVRRIEILPGCTPVESEQAPNAPATTRGKARDRRMRMVTSIRDGWRSCVARDRRLLLHSPGRRSVMYLTQPPTLRAHQLPVRHPMRLIGVDALPLAEILLVRPVVPLEPHDLGVPLEREDVRRDAVEEPAIVGDHDGTSREIDERILERA